MTYIGVDPGRSGAMAIIETREGEEDFIVTTAFDKDDYIVLLQRAKRDGTKVICALERVNAMPGQGVTSMFTFGENFGWIQGILDAYHIPYELVRPQKWKKEFGLTGEKLQSVAVCKHLFPEVSLLRTDRSRKDDDGLAEALLLCEYARRHL